MPEWLMKDALPNLTRDINKYSYSILEVAKMFKSKIKLLPRRSGERYASALTSMTASTKIYKNFGSIKLKDYINNFLSENS